MGSLALFDFFFSLSCGDHPVKQSGKKAAFKLVSTPQFVHSNDHTNREAELKKKRVSPVPWGREGLPGLPIPQEW